MARNRRFPPAARALSLVQQKVNLCRMHPSLRVTVRGDKLLAEGPIRGSPITAVYQIRLRYRKGYEPRVFILDPPLKRRLPDQPVAHTNGPNEPCLFTPQRDWHGRLYLGHSVIPWLMEWIVFYEAWLLTGKWAGGGTLPAGYNAEDIPQSAHV